LKLNSGDKVFLSSPFGDILPYREEAHRTLQSLGLEPILLEKKWGPLRRDALDDSIVRNVCKEVSKCSAVVVILGERLGIRVPGTAFTMVEHEILSAQEAGIPIFTYVTPASRFFSRLKQRILLDEHPDIRLLAQSEEVYRTNDPSEFSSRLRRDLKLRLDYDVRSREMVLVSPVSTRYWATLAAQPEELARCSSRFFEELVAELLRADGWNVELVARNNAPGPDIVACSSRIIDSVPARLVVECKRYRRDRPVGVGEVRNLVYWLNEEYKATLGMIVTTSYFTKQAQSLAQEMHRWRVSLVDQRSIIRWLQRHVVSDGR
jgi:HJR/Mrr/RecB family endonuclease